MSSVVLTNSRLELLCQKIRCAQSQVSYRLVTPIETLRGLPNDCIMNLAINWGIEDEVLQPNSAREVLLRKIQRAQSQQSRLYVSDIGILRGMSDDRILDLAIRWHVNYAASFLVPPLLNSTDLPEDLPEELSDSSNDYSSHR